MNNDENLFKRIKNQTLTIIEEITKSPKPTYTLEGQRVAWEEYLQQLQETVEWCDKMMANTTPFEMCTTAGT
ncbi:MAG: hypothetical protein Q4D38_08050 [Planctomycetia bacterium]|nr:hypothetical protein [Planctomycetia bacterium]